MSQYPKQISKRNINVSQISLSLTNKVKDSFEINAVPDDIVSELKELCRQLESAELRIQDIIDDVRKHDETFLCPIADITPSQDS